MWDPTSTFTRCRNLIPLYTHTHTHTHWKVENETLDTSSTNVYQYASILMHFNDNRLSLSIYTGNSGIMTHHIQSGIKLVILVSNVNMKVVMIVDLGFASMKDLWNQQMLL